MARDMLAILGYETGGAAEMDPAITSLWAAILTTPAPPSAKETYVAQMAWKAKSSTIPATFVSGHWVTVSLHNRYTFDTSTAVFVHTRIVDGSGAVYLQVKYKASPATKTLELYDSNDVLIFSWSGVTKDDWHNIEIKFKPENATSDVKVFMGGAEVVSAAGVDCDPGNATNSVQVQLTNAEATGHIYYNSNIIIESDDGANIDSEDTLGHERVVLGPYTYANSGATPDYGDDLTIGTWNLTAEVPDNDTNEVKYNAESPILEGGMTTTDGSRSGPELDPDAEDGGIFLGASWGWRAKRAGGTPGQTIKRKWGKQTLASKAVDNTTSALTTLSASYQNFWEVHSASHVDTPTPNRYFQIGFGVGDGFNNKDVFLAEMWCFLAYQEPAPTETILDYERKTRGVGRGIMRGVA